MNESKAKFVDRTGFTARDIDLWPAVVITRQEIEAEADRLAALPAPQNGRRSSLIVHPRAAKQGQGLAPAIQVSLDVLKPGERTRAIRHNSTVANFCIRGAGHSIVNGKRIAFSRYDVWNAPSMAIYQHVNDTDEIQVRLAYSNAALLEKLNIHFVEDDPPPVEEVAEPRTQEGDERRAHPFGTFQLTPEGAQLMPYEKLVAPDAVESKALHWPWKMVKAHLDKLESLGKDYVGRRLYLLYNPMTGRTNGTTPCFFTTMCLRPPNIVDRPHRHTSAAINYYFAGSGRKQSAYAIEAAVSMGIPVWVGFSCEISDDDSQVVLLRSKGETFAEALDTLLPIGGSLVSVMHSKIEDTTPALRVVQERWDGPLGAYPESGRFVMPNWQFEDVIPPKDFLAKAREQVQMGTQLIGGCCGIGPEHIRLLREGLPSHVSTEQQSVS